MLEAAVSLALAGFAALAVTGAARLLLAAQATRARSSDTGAALAVAHLASSASVPDCPATASLVLGGTPRAVCVRTEQLAGQRFFAVRSARVDGVDRATWVDVGLCWRQLNSLHVFLSLRPGPFEYGEITVTYEGDPVPTIGFQWQGKSAPPLRAGAGRLTIVLAAVLSGTYEVTLSGVQTKPFTFGCEVP